MMPSLAICAMLGASALAPFVVAALAPQSASRAIFERRILPILKSPNPSSCSECHLSGVDLKDYIRPSESETFASLRARGLIDLKRPYDSKILKLIKMSTPKTSLVNQRGRDAEFEAFKEWISAGSKNPVLSNAMAAGKLAGPAVPNAVIRHTRMDNVLASFVRNVWSQQGRCMDCHTPGTKANEENARKFGERVKWFVPESPEATMRKLISQKLINVDQPDQSLFLLKPLNKVPHGGGVKLLMGDAGYKQFRAWIEDYARSVKGTYRTEKDLPRVPDHTYVFTDCILTPTQCPVEWGDKLLRVDAYVWDTARNRWSAEPVATGDRQVFAEWRETNISMWLIPIAGSEAEKSARRSPRLASGRYLLRYYCDVAGKLDLNYTMPTDSEVFFKGEQEIISDWPIGFGKRTIVPVRQR
jgi:hypothetical protein